MRDDARGADAVDLDAAGGSNPGHNFFERSRICQLRRALELFGFELGELGHHLTGRVGSNDVHTERIVFSVPDPLIAASARRSCG